MTRKPNLKHVCKALSFSRPSSESGPEFGQWVSTVETMCVAFTMTWPDGGFNPAEFRRVAYSTTIRDFVNGWIALVWGSEGANQ